MSEQCCTERLLLSNEILVTVDRIRRLHAELDQPCASEADTEILGKTLAELRRNERLLVAKLDIHCKVHGC